MIDRIRRKAKEKTKTTMMVQRKPEERETSTIGDTLKDVDTNE